MGRDLRKNQAKMNIPIRVAAVLFCMTLLSIYLVAGLFARYVTSVENNDGARVAKFSIQGTQALSQGIEVSVAPGASVPVNLVIENNSEVSVEYTIAVTNVTKNLSLSFTMKKDGAVVEPVEGESAATYAGQQIPGEHIDTYILNVKWDAGDLAQMGMVDYIAVTVTAVQID